MPLVNSAIIAACINAGNAQEACLKALEAGSKQAGIYEAQEKAHRYLYTRLKNTLSKEELFILTSSGFLYKTVKNKKVTFRIKNIGFCNYIDNEFSLDSSLLKFNWNF